ncbi:hypothetical protein [Shinella sp. BYT-45]
MPASLIDSQFDALEPPTADERSITNDINASLEVVVDQIVTLGSIQ